MFSRLASRGWFWAAVALTLVKLWLTSAQTIYAIGPALHDDRLFVELAAHLIDGQWLGPYNQFTLAKGPMFPLFIAGVFWLGLPLVLAQQLVYAAACAAVTGALRPWLRTSVAWFATYAFLLWNPMSFDAGNLSRVMRQNLYTPLALFCVTGCILLFSRRRESWKRQAGPAILAGLSLGCFWLTREESVWFLPAVALLLVAPLLALGRELLDRWRTPALVLGCFAASAALPLVIICTLNLRYYGWFGTVEFQARDFKDAYGALMRLQVGPTLPQVPVTRQMREQAYTLSPTFRRLQPQLEGPVGDHWADQKLFPAAERQIRGGWFVWAIRDAMAEAGLAPDARTALANYRAIAAEINAACDAGLVPARPPRSGFLPPLGVNDVGPLLDETVTYTEFFLLFHNFTAHAPDSVGDYAELKPFRNVVGTRLSQAPRSPEAPTPEQDRQRAWKVDQLERIGELLVTLIAWLGPVLLLVGAGRLIQSAIDHHLSLALGLAVGLLLACGAYVAINVLVQVTSFYNMSPAALHSAYPLYLLALVAIVIDAVHAWRHSRTFSREAIIAVPRTAWLAAGGAALLVFSARLAEIHFFASDVPYNDQWVIEAEQIIAPWLDGTLSLRNFFIPHFEHLPVWTRLLAWLEVALTGRWDPLVQMTVNAALHAGFIWIATRWIWQSFRPTAAAALTMLVVLTGCLPHAWENIAWGFQSQFPLALILLFLHVRGAATELAGSRGWWLAQLAGVAGLLTLASFWLAPLAVLLSWLWTGPRRRLDLLVPGLITASGIATLAAIRLTGDTSFTQVTRTAITFVHSSLHLLGWPSILPGAAALVQLPWLVHAFRLRRQSDTAPVDRVILVLGLVNFMQAVALAFGRTGDNNDFVSRYGDLLVLGILAGGFALCRLVPAPGRGRFAFSVIAAAWAMLVVAGLVRNSTEGHAHYFHTYAAENATLRRDALRNYLTDGNRTLLDAPATKWVLYQDPALVVRLLDQPRFRALLPATVEPRNPPVPAGRFVRALQARWLPGLLAGAFALTAGALWQGWRERGRTPLPPLVTVPDPWRWRAAALVGSAALVAMLVWSNPVSFDASARWQRWLGGDQALQGLSFSFATESPFGPERLQGAAPILPEQLRNQFYGTAPAGPGFTGTVLSTPFTLSKNWLIVPYAGYPVGDGNGLRIRLLRDDGTATGEELNCDGPNSESVNYWIVDVRSHHGQRAQVVLYDGRTDTEAWVAAAPPIVTDRPEIAATLAQGLMNEQHAAAHASLGIVALTGLLAALAGWLGHRRTRV